MPLMRAPTKLRRLRALADKAVDRPGVDELAGFLRNHRDLGVALGDMDRLDAEPAGERGPFAARRRDAPVEPGVGAKVNERLLDEMRYEAGIGAVRHDRGRPRPMAPADGEDALAQRVIRARRRRQLGIGITTRPRLDAGIQIEGFALLAQLDQRGARHIDRHVQEKIAAAQTGFQHRTIVRTGERLLDKGDPVFGRHVAAAPLRRHDRDLLSADVEMAQQQRQDTLADAAEADDHEMPGEPGVLLVEHEVRHTLGNVKP